MASPLVTAICCAYNYARWLPRALDSALAQGLGPELLEVVVVDDGSTDDTPEVIRPYLASPAIRYVRKQNGGFPSAVSRGLDEARGRYVVFLDADDEWPLDRRLHAQVEALERNPQVGLVYSDMEVIDEHGRTTHPRYLESIGVDHPSGPLLARLYESNVVSGGALMVRSELRHLFNPIPAQIRCQDWWIATRVASVAEILWVPGVVYRYRRHGENMNLGQADRTANLRDDIEFRRLVLSLPETERLSLREVIESARPLIGAGAGYRSLATVSDADRTRGDELERRGLALAGAGRPEDACRTLIAAQAADPSVDRQPLFAQL